MPLRPARAQFSNRAPSPARGRMKSRISCGSDTPNPPCVAMRKTIQCVQNVVLLAFSQMRILIATVTAGGGHLAAAAALEEAWRAARPDDVVEKIDLLKLFSPLHRKIYSDGYVKLVERAPELWGMVFARTDNPKLLRRLKRIQRKFPSGSKQRFARHVKQFNPDVVLCTHYLPLETLTPLREKKDGIRPFVVVHRHGFRGARALDGIVRGFVLRRGRGNQGAARRARRGSEKCDCDGNSHRGEILLQAGREGRAQALRPARRFAGAAGVERRIRHGAGRGNPRPNSTRRRDNFKRSS